MGPKAHSGPLVLSGTGSGHEVAVGEQGHLPASMALGSPVSSQVLAWAQQSSMIEQKERGPQLLVAFPFIAVPDP